MGRGAQQEHRAGTPARGADLNGASVADENKQWVLIDNVEYDVTNFMRRHPGGSVIKYGLANTGADATEMYKAFHLRSRKANLILKTLPKREPQCKIQPGQSVSEDSKEGEINRAFVKFEEGLKAEGFFETSMTHVALRVAELAALFCLGLLAFSKGYTVTGVLLHGLFGGRCGWVQHEAGHGSFVNSVWLGHRIQHIFIGFGLGTSGHLWRVMHNKHHSATQKVGHDLDIDTAPVVSFFKTAVEKSKFRTPMVPLWARAQAFTFLPLTSGVFVMGFWLGFLHPRHVVRNGLWEEALWMLSSHIVRTWLVQLCTGWSLTSSYLIGYWAAMWVSGMYLFGHFSLSHTHKDVVERDVHKSWLRYALEHTVDIDPGFWPVDWIMGYLNCQVIHHLWPQMPQFHQPEVSRRLTAFCEEHGLEYDKISYWSAWKKTLGNLHEVGQHYAEIGGIDKSLKTD
uniref:Delta6 desaturase n=1 Tax=Thraustochytrium sp. (strain ATCC 26185 / S-3) TaxID=672127 RepID=A0A1B3PEJ1_THRS2|nr:delta6 desaturase [Thraustochytrium sp. ATCC 26185]